MRFGGKSLAVALVALYVGAVWVRLDHLGETVYPYYNGESGTHFRHTQMIADGGRLPAVDVRASRPEGYPPARVMPNGAEYFTGYAIRLVRPFTDASDKRVAAVLLILVTSLSVFAMYFLTRRLWDCRAAGGFAAFLAAFSSSLVAATGGREFLHGPYAFLVVSIHLALAAGITAPPSAARTAAAALSALALFSAWSGAGLYIALFALAVLVLPFPAETRRRVLASHLAVAIAAGLVFPHLRADRFVFAWPVAWLIVATAYAFLGAKIPRRIPAWVYLPAALALLAVVMGSVRSGGIELLDPLEYWYYRIRYVSGKPDDPTLLPAAVRIAWTGDHGPPSLRELAVFFVPLLLLVVPACGVLRRFKADRGTPLWPFIAAAGIGAAAFVIDARAVFAAALAVFPLAAGAFRGFRANLKTRAASAILAVYLVAAGSSLVPHSLDARRLVGRRLDAAANASEGFRAASVGNADRELVRFLATRTSTRSDVILAPPEISSVVATFAGRSTVLVPGVYSRHMAEKIVEATADFYATEDDLYDRCRNLEATYVVYSIDVFLDDTPFSPRYAAAEESPPRGSLAYDMHFAAEKLRRFQLVYENDGYRVFRVTPQTQPVFLSDHPPVYQEDVFLAMGGDRGAFYQRVVDALVAYHLAVESQAAGDEEEAIRRFEYAIGHVPRFTAARLGVGDSLLRLGRPREAYEAYRFVLAYAPDNAHALYYGALALAYTDRREEARRLVELLLTATADREMRRDALELKNALESGRMVEMPARAAPDSTK